MQRVALTEEAFLELAALMSSAGVFDDASEPTSEALARWEDDGGRILEPPA